MKFLKAPGSEFQLYNFMTEYYYPNIKTFSGGKKKPCLLVFGAIHGDEVCGPYAINKIAKDIESKHLILKRGTVILVPICNPIAYKRGKRFIDENLNRVFKNWKDPDSYEKKLANDLTKLVHKCDIILDIHSVSAKSAPLVFVDFPNKKNISFARILGASYILRGWPEVYKNSEFGKPSNDTISFAQTLSKNGLTLECGQHNDQKSKKVAYRSIISALNYLGITKGKTKSKNINEITIKKLFIRKNNKDRFIKNWKNFDAFKKGDALAVRENGKKVVATFNGVIIMPNKNAEVDAEWFYTGINKKPRTARSGS